MVYSPNWAQHLVDLARVLERLQTYGLVCALEKCHFGRTQLPFLGHIVTSDHNEAKQEHIRGVLEAKAPRCKKDMQKFIGLCMWISEYISNFAQVAAPLTSLLSSRKPYKWTAEAQAAFDEVKELCRRPLRLHRPTPGKRLFLQTDACDLGMGATLYQKGDDGARRIISYASAKFTKAEKGCHSNERECLAMVWAIRKYRHLGEDTRFTLRTDNKALTWLYKVQDERGKLTRWAMYLMRFSFDVEHVPGRDNELPDALSRFPGEERFHEDEGEYEAMEPPARRLSDGEPIVAHLDARALRGEVPQAQQDHRPTSPERGLAAPLQEQRGAQHLIEPGRRPRLYVPPAARMSVMAYHHDDGLAGHPGAAETTRTIAKDYYWPLMRRDVRQYVRTCQECRLAKAAQPVAHRQEITHVPVEERRAGPHGTLRHL